MNTPHGGTLVNRMVTGSERTALAEKSNSLPRIELDAWALSDLEMIAIGAFSPLEGFMSRQDYESVVKNRRLANGLVWTIPVTLSVDDATAKSVKSGSEAALTKNGSVVAILHVSDAYQPDKNQ